MLSQAELASLKIRDFIFHVVHHGEEKPILFDETRLGNYEGFFLDRVRDTLRGNRFEFVDGSRTCELLRKIVRTPKEFVAVSKELAIDFHSRQDKRIKPGVLILMRLGVGDRTLFLLIKYDHERVLTYRVQSRRALLRDVQNSFTESPSALHKSALIELVRTGGELVIIDRTVRKDITDFFRGFLNVQRKYENKQMTVEIGKAVYETIKAHQDTLPQNLVQNWRPNLSELARRAPEFETDQFLDRFFGAHASEEVSATFRQEMKKRDLEGEVFDLDPAAVQSIGPARYRTVEGVGLQVSPEARDYVKITKGEDGFTMITIRSRSLIEQP
jgi:37-kD nucleoid-associated bacterial protein